MSAYIVPDEHINYLVSYALEQRLYFWHDGMNYSFSDKDTAEKMAGVLHNTNVESVNCRYEEDTMPRPFQFFRLFVRFDPIDVLMACQGYDYQSCELPDYDNTLANRVIETIKKAAIHNLPGFNDSKAWCIFDANKL